MWRERMKAAARERRRSGYRRLRLPLRREGFLANHQRLFRPYREERLTVRRRGGREQAIGTGAPMTLPTRPNEHWSLDVVAGQTAGVPGCQPPGRTRSWDGKRQRP
ncbi:hypothetical protein GCM10028812_07310 [Ancylobacter sonchi]